MENIIEDNITVDDAADKKHFDMVLSLALDLCAGLLNCGASVNRAEIACQKICLAFGAEEVNVFAFPSIIEASIKLSDGSEFSQIKRIYSSSNNLHKLEVLNQLSRDICQNKYDVLTAREKLDGILSCKFYRLPVVVAGGALASGAFTVFFGGSIIDAIPAFIIGFFMAWLNFLMSDLDFNGYARTFVLSVFGGISSIFLCWILELCGVECNCSLIMIGTIMVVIPGLLVCNAFRDMFSGDLFSGTFELINGILLTLAIAAGYGASMFILKNILTIREIVPRTGAEYYVYITISCVLAAVGFSLMFNCHLKNLIYATLNIIVVFAVYLIMEEYLGDLFIDTLVATLVAALFAEILARVLKAPATIFLVPAIIPYVPGYALYYTMSGFVSGSKEQAIAWGQAAGITFLGIAVGIIIIGVLIQAIYTVKSRLDKRKQIK